MRNDATVTLSGWVEVSTAKAHLFHSDFMNEPIWIPKSQITEERVLEGVQRYEFDVKEWIVSKNSWE